MKTLLITVLTFSFGLSTSFAKRKKKAHERQENQRARIQQGVESGELNKREVKRLRQGQRNVSNYKKEAKADGDFTKEERKKLRRKQNRQSERIHRNKHDDQRNHDYQDDNEI